MNIKHKQRENQFVEINRIVDNFKRHLQRYFEIDV